MDDFPVHPQVQKTLERLLARGRIPHAYLFLGQDEYEKRAAAKGFLQALLCGEKKSRAHAEEQCVSCTAFVRGVHPDFSYIIPDGSPSYIPLNAIRELRRHLALRAVAEKKAALIERAELLEPEAASALLKMLEEPPGETIFVLTTAAPTRILKTLRSRLIYVHFPVWSQGAVDAFFSTRGIAHKEAIRVCRIARGLPAYAFTLLKDPELLREEFETQDFLAELLEDSIPEQFRKIGEFESAKKSLSEFSSRLLFVLRDVLVRRFRTAPEAQSGQEPEPFGRLSRSKLALLLTQLLELEGLCSRRALSPRLALESFLLSLEASKS